MKISLAILIMAASIGATPAHADNSKALEIMSAIERAENALDHKQPNTPAAPGAGVRETPPHGCGPDANAGTFCLEDSDPAPNRPPYQEDNKNEQD